MLRNILALVTLGLALHPIAASGSENTVKTCAAVRGNGDRLLAHFGSMGRYHDYYAPFDGIAGGSSGSITAFLYESMRMNPLLKTCQGQPCSSDEERLRLSFLLKSMMGYVDAYKESEEVQALLYSINVVEKLKAIVADQSFQELVTVDAKAAAIRILTVLESPEFRGLINPDLIKLFKESSNIPFHVQELDRNIRNFGSWKAADSTIFFFPGFVNWPEFARRIGRIADFYAGYGEYYPKAAVDDVLKECAPALQGKDWYENEGSGCQTKWTSLIADYRKNNRADRMGPHRIQDPIGRGMTVLASTSILKGPENLAQYTQAFDDYRSGRPLDFKPVFSEIRMGYFGRATDLERIQKNERAYSDTRTARFEALGPRAWQDIISVSPAEPSLSEIRPVDAGRYSVGGWIDLSPSLVLKNAGCDQVVYFTRYVDSTSPGFASDVIRLLNASEPEIEQIIGARAEVSPLPSFILSNNEASAVWCTDWDAPAMGDFKAQFKKGFDGILYTEEGYFRDGDRAYPQMESRPVGGACIR